MLCELAAGGVFEAKNPGLDSAISDPPPDMRFKPPMHGEVDHRPTGNPVGRNQQYDNFLPSTRKPRNLQAEKSGNRGNSLSHGDFLKGRNPNW